MQPRTLQSVLSELDSVYAPQIDSLRQQQSAIPGQMQSEEQGLQAKQDTAFGDILNGARRRGMGFSGIPLQEQARYTADNYLPALANLHQASKQQATSLEDAILGIQERQRTQGQSIYEGDRNFAEQQRQFNATQQLQRDQMAAQQAAVSSFNPSLGGYGGQSPSQGGSVPLPTRKQDGGWGFADANGRPISAAAYAQATGTPFRDVLQRMASAGDKGAQTALSFVGNDYGYDPNKANNQQSVNLYNSLVWGVHPQASVAPIRLANNPRF